MKRIAHLIGIALLALAGSGPRAVAQGTAFTYQGRLNDGTSPASGIYDLRFSIYDAAGGAGGGAGGVAGPVTNSATGVTNGLFTVTLDFGAGVFAGAERWLEIGVRTNGGGTFTTLAPRQKISPSPYAFYSFNAGSATGVAAGAIGTNELLNAAVTSAKIADGSITAADVNSASFSNTFWKANGNAGTTAGTHFLGTTDNRAFEVKVNSTRGLRLEPGSGGRVNVIGGTTNNAVAAGATSATIAGGQFNTIGQYASASVIGGGNGNTLGEDADSAVIAGGDNNRIGLDADYSAIGGGDNNSNGDDAQYSRVGGGRNNAIGTDSLSATIAGGGWNSIGTNTSSSVIGGGSNNEIGDNTSGATIPGGAQNFATTLAFAAGYRAKANHSGAFVWADWQFADFASTAANQFLIRAAGGVGIGTAAPSNPLTVEAAGTTSGGANGFTEVVARFKRPGASHSAASVDANTGQDAILYLAENGSAWWGLRHDSDASHKFNLRYQGGGANTTVLTVTTNANVGIGNTSPSDRLTVVNARCDGSSWINASDRRLKQDFVPVDPKAVLEKVVALPVQQWSYRAQPDQKHVGPVAQDFRAAFGLGEDDTSIATVDADGVALAAIQGLNQKVNDELATLRAELKRRDAENAELRRELQELKQQAGARAGKQNGGAR